MASTPPGSALPTTSPANGVVSALSGFWSWGFPTTVSVLAALLGSFLVTSSNAAYTATTQGGIVIAVALFLLTWVAMVVWPRRNPPRLSVPDSLPGRGFIGSSPYGSTWDDGDVQERSHLPTREVDVTALINNWADQDVSVAILHGKIGCGKTSLVRAELVRHLKQRGCVVWCVKSTGANPWRDIRCSVTGIVGDKTDEDEDRRAVDASIRATKDRTLIVILDGFERFYLDRASRVTAPIPFFAWLGEQVRLRGGRLRFLLVVPTELLQLIRDDYRNANTTAPKVRDYELKEFRLDQAEKALRELAWRDGLPLEEELCRAIVRDLQHGRRVSPADLQLVGEQLREQAIYTLPAYCIAGGSVGLLRVALHDVAEREGLSSALKALAPQPRKVRDAGSVRLGSVDRPPRGAIETGTCANACCPDEWLALDLTPDARNALLEYHLVEHDRDGRLRLARPHVRGASRPRGTNWLADVSYRVVRQVGVRMRYQYRAWGSVLAFITLLCVVGSVAFLFVAGYPEGPELTSLDPPLNAVEQLAFDPNGRYLAADTGDSILVWDLNDLHKTGRNLKATSFDKGELKGRKFPRYLDFQNASRLRLFTASEGKWDVWSWDIANPSGPYKEENLGGDLHKDADGSGDSTLTGTCNPHQLAADRDHYRLAVLMRCVKSRDDPNATFRTQIIDLKDRTVEAAPPLVVDSKCTPKYIAFNRGGSALLEFSECSEDTADPQSPRVLLPRLYRWNLDANPPRREFRRDESRYVQGTVQKVLFGDSGQILIVVSASEEGDTQLWDLSERSYRSRWRLESSLDSKAVAADPTTHRLAALVWHRGASQQYVTVYAPSFWPFWWLPVEVPSRPPATPGGAGNVPRR